MRDEDKIREQLINELVELRRRNQELETLDTERKRVEKQVRQSCQQLRDLYAHFQSVREAERAEIAREIHDDLGQVLTALRIDLSWLEKRLTKEPEPVPEKIKSMLRLADTTIQTVKRISVKMRPGLLDDVGLAAAIEWQAAEFQNRTGIRCILNPELEDTNLDQGCSTMVFRVFQEVLTNISHHANATMVQVSLREKGGRLVLEVGDNGIGIEDAEITNPKSFGLIGMREHARYWGGDVKISGTRGKGTTVTMTTPIDREGKA